MKFRIFGLLLLAFGLMLTGCQTCDVCEQSSVCDPCPATQPALGPGCCPSPIRTWGDCNVTVPCGRAIKLEKMVPQEVRNNCPFDYEIKVTNVSNCTLTNVVVTDHLPSNLRFECSTPEMVSMVDGIAKWDLGCLEAGECRMISVNAIAEGEGCITSCADVTYENPVCASMSIVESRLKVSKAAPDCALSCDRIPLSYVVTNCGNANACDVVVTDKLPQGFITTDGCDILRFDVGNLACGECREFQCMVEATDLGTFGSSAVATSSTCDTVESNYAATNIVKPELEIVQSGPSEQYICKDVCYSVTVMNKSNCTADGAVLTTQIPCYAYQRCSQGGQLCGDQIRWDIGSLAPGESKTYNFVLTGSQPGILKTTSSVVAHCADPVCAQSETTLSGVAALLMEVVDVCDPIEVGQNETYIITITNQGTAIATNIQLSAMLEDNMQFVSSTGPTSAQEQANMISFGSLAQLCPGDKAVWRLNVKALAEGDTRFKAMFITDQLSREVEETEATNVYMATPCGR